MSSEPGTSACAKPNIAYPIMHNIYIENLPHDATPSTVEAIFGSYLGTVKHAVELCFDANRPNVAIVSFPDLSSLALHQIERKFHRYYFAGKLVRMHAPVFD